MINREDNTNEIIFNMVLHFTKGGWGREDNQYLTIDWLMSYQ